MSTATPTVPARSTRGVPRLLALLGVALLTLAYVSTLYWVTGVRGGQRWLVAGLGIGVVAAVLLHGRDEREVFSFAAVAAVVAGVWYAATVRTAPGTDTVWRMVLDTVALFSGVSVLELAAVDVWIAAVVPVPVFLSTYFALRRRYVYAALSGGWLVCFLTLTGDATAVETLAGTIGAVAVVGFGEIDRRGGSLAGADVLIVVVALMAVGGAFVPLVPAGEATTLTPAGGAQGGAGGSGAGAGGTADDPAASALDEELLTGGPVQPTGPVELSSEVRFVVESDEHRRWRVNVLDRYDGQGWYRSQRSRPYDGPQLGPPGATRTVEQTVEIRTATTGALPHAATPVEVGEDVAPITRVTSGGAVRSERPLEAGTTYTVQSEVPDASPEELAAAGTDYPPRVEEQYLDLPSNVPGRVENLSAQITSDTDSSYEAAVAIDAYLQDTKAYSLNVSPPEGTLVDGFLFEMDAGYCTYFAASMATMLRTQDVPARVAVGYNAGQWVDGDTSVVRGTDAHAWVEVHYPGVGWVEHDPTPSAEWQREHADAVEDARAAGADGVDVAASENESVRYDPPTDESADTGNESSGTGTVDASEQNGSLDGVPRRDVSGRGDGDQPYVDPDEQLQAGTDNESADAGRANASVVDESTSAAATRLLGGFEDLLLGVLVLAGTLAGARRVGLVGRFGRSTWLVYQRRRDPATDADVAIDRLERWVGERYPRRRAGETPREYVARLPGSVDDRVLRAYELHERVRYAGDADGDAVDELVDVVDSLTRSSLPVLGRLWT